MGSKLRDKRCINNSRLSIWGKLLPELAKELDLGRSLHHSSLEKQQLESKQTSKHTAKSQGSIWVNSCEFQELAAFTPQHYPLPSLAMKVN